MYNRLVCTAAASLQSHALANASVVPRLDKFSMQGC